MRSTLPTFNEIWQRKFRASVLRQQAQFKPETTFLVGCSGGMDSMLLLFLLSQLFPQRVRAIYIDHQLQEISTQWAIEIEQFCQQLGIEFVIEKVNVLAGNTEEQARKARYIAFKQHLQSDDILVLAHHQQDQAETVLLRLLSGAGVAGLAAMQAFEEHSGFKLWRPFLSLDKAQIEHWVHTQNIPYVQDAMNFDLAFDRVWCRKIVWPVLQARFAKMQDAISRTSQIMQDANSILTEVVEKDLSDCQIDEQCIDLIQFQALSIARQRQLLSYWMKGDNQYRPSFDMVERVLVEVIGARKDANAALHWNDFYYTRYKNKLYRILKTDFLESTKNQDDVQKISFDLTKDIAIASGQFRLKNAKVGLMPELLETILDLKFRQGGEKIHLWGRVGHWSLKKAVQEAEILPWQRHRVQILYKDDIALGVFTPKGFWLAQSKYCVENGWLPEIILDSDLILS